MWRSGPIGQRAEGGVVVCLTKVARVREGGDVWRGVRERGSGR